MTRISNLPMIGPQTTSEPGPGPAKPALHIEVCVNGDDADQESLGQEVAKWLRANYTNIEPNQAISAPDLFRGSKKTQYIQVADVTGREGDGAAASLADIDLTVHVFKLDEDPSRTSLFSSHSSSESAGSDGGPDLPQAKVIRLPSKELNGIWESLTFNEPIHVRLLHSVTRMMAFATRQVTARTVVWNRLVLLYGPPGTGKTSLCRALAQKLSIRLGKQYSHSKLIEVHSHSLFSKFFGESGKLVGVLFEEVERLLEKEKETFVCILIDEVESLTSARDQAAGRHEPRDALRAVNALLTALDRLRYRPNVVVLCTSNLIEAMDSAFLDRVDIKQHIPQPSATARYEIYRLCYLELAQAGLIAPVQDYEEDDAGAENGDVERNSPGTVTGATRWRVLNEDALPVYHMMQLQYWRDQNPDSVARKLWAIAEKSDDISARTLRRLPALALAMYTNSDPCPIDEALTALSRAVEDERSSRLGARKDA
ncbi:MAG: pachytene checkpoint component Pch2 [Lasallia pustulata]|uniref:Pachytene checkpoint component Pch2 n=1 Tax=Lasallia pustulata TaxID=136370 RepID=A0A5M8PT56_9LECA|nr:MAG: pachytene checkpoint component Pch2 [Lasallia pustulata]